jgi:hypothetical protein
VHGLDTSGRVQRVADALFEKRTLITTDVDRLVYGKIRR